MALAKKVGYAAIAKKRISSPGNKPKRFLVYGRNKKGKTWFGNSMPNTLVLDPEVGTEELPDDAQIWAINQWEDIGEAFKYLRSGEHELDAVCVDGLTRIANMALRYVMKQQEERDLDRIPGMVQKKDYGMAGELMKGMFFNFHTLPITVIYTAQERQEIPGEFDSEDEDSEQAEARFVPDLPKGVRSAVNAIVNVIGRVYTVKLESSKNPGEYFTQRRLWIGTSEAFDTGYRSKHKLPDMIKNPTVPKLVNLVNTGKVSR